jgi:hypothetical protein
MKNKNPGSVIAAVLMLLIWSITTLLLGISVVGWIALGMMSEDKEGWFSIPNKCVKVLC